MKKLLLYLLLSLSFSAFAQEKKDTVAKKENRWSLNAEGAFVYAYPTYYFLYNPKTDITSGFGIYVQYKFDNTLNIAFGASYDLLKYQTSLLEDTSINSGFLRKDIFKYSLIDISSKLNFNVGKRKLFFSISPGIGLSILVNNLYQSYRPFSFETKLFSNGAVCIFGDLAMEVNYKLNNKIILYLQPELFHSFTPIVYNFQSTSVGMVSEDNYLKYFKTTIGINYNF